ncbi:MAG: hypothetical protein ABJN69_03465 [Hellea sp.]
MFYARAAAIVYVLWGLLHINSALIVYKMGQNLEYGMVQGRVFQDAWNLMFFALFGIIVAIFLNWKNSKVGYWGNLIVVSAGDIGFIVTMILPGYVPWIPGGLGPLLWVSAAILSTIAIKQQESHSV